MYGDRIVEIEQLTTGYKVEVFDADKHAKNQASEKGTKKDAVAAAPYQDPHTTHAFDSWDEVLAFLKKVGPKLSKVKPADADSVGAHFARAVKEEA